MAEGDAHVCNNFKEQLLLKQIDCDSDTFKVALFNVAWATSLVDGEQVYGVSICQQEISFYRYLRYWFGKLGIYSY